MNCPCCNKEMQTGYIHNGNQPIQWIPEGKKPSAFRFSVTEDGVKLKNKSGMSGYKATAYYCSNCSIVIAPTDK